MVSPNLLYSLVQKSCSKPNVLLSSCVITFGTFKLRVGRDKSYYIPFLPIMKVHQPGGAASTPHSPSNDTLTTATPQRSSRVRPMWSIMPPLSDPSINLHIHLLQWQAGGVLEALEEWSLGRPLPLDVSAPPQLLFIAHKVLPI